MEASLLSRVRRGQSAAAEEKSEDSSRPLLENPRELNASVLRGNSPPLLVPPKEFAALDIEKDERRERKKRNKIESLWRDDFAISLPRFHSCADCHRTADTAAGNGTPSIWVSAPTTHRPAAGGHTHVSLCFRLDSVSTRLPVLRRCNRCSLAVSGVQLRLPIAPPGGRTAV